MKPTERVLDVDSTLAGENVRMGIDQSAMQHVMSILTDLYSDPEMAVIREYSTNALDAHRDAGNPMPIEVTLPTPLAPFFRVRDYGDGLDAEDIRSIYSQYGTSTKRESNDVVGMLGLGCKSALTYTDQFTLVGTKDGRTVQVSIHRDEDGGGSMTIVSDEATPDAPSGVEVIVPAQRTNEFERKAREFFRFWTKGSVLVSGSEPEHVSDTLSPTWLVPDKLFVYDPDKANERNYNAYSDTSSPGWVVMGNVAYPMPEASNQRSRKYRVVAFVDIGDVNFAPSREALMLTKRTKDTLETIMETTRRELAGAMQKRVITAASPSDAIRLVQEANVYGVKTAGLMFEGKQIPVRLERTTLMGDKIAEGYLVVDFAGRYGRKSGARTRQIPPYGAGRMIFTGYSSKDFSAAKRAKFEAWLDQEGIDKPRQLICVESLTADEAYWLKGVPTYDWAPVQAIKVANGGTVGPSWKARPAGSYKKEGGGHIEAGDIDCTVPLLYIHTHERAERQDRDQRRPARQYPDGALVLVMPANRLEKFKRDFAHAMHWLDYVKKEATDWLNQQDAALVEAAKYQISDQGSALTGLDPTRIADPDLARAVIAQNIPCAAVKSGIEKRTTLDITRHSLSSKYPDPLKDYPLVGNGGRKLADHIYLYVNAAYNAAHPAKESA